MVAVNVTVSPKTASALEIDPFTSAAYTFILIVFINKNVTTEKIIYLVNFDINFLFILSPITAD